ncbi:hypothetical protein ACYF68_11400 [Salinicoccus sp. CNSTN-B1]
MQIKIDHTNRMDEVVEYILDDGITTHHFEGSVGDRVSEDAVAICADKSILREHLQKADIKIPGGKVFDESSPLETIREYVQKESYPLVLKSADDNLVKHIHDDQSTGQAIEYLQNKMDGHKIIVERHPEGGNSQLYVVGEKVFHLTGQAVNEDARKLALEAVKSIPGLLQGSVIINTDEDSKEHSVIDINPHADIKKNESHLVMPYGMYRRRLWITIFRPQKIMIAKWLNVYILTSTMFTLHPKEESQGIWKSRAYQKI